MVEFIVKELLFWLVVIALLFWIASFSLKKYRDRDQD